MHRPERAILVLQRSRAPARARRSTHESGIPKFLRILPSIGADIDYYVDLTRSDEINRKLVWMFVNRADIIAKSLDQGAADLIYRGPEEKRTVSRLLGVL